MALQLQLRTSAHAGNRTESPHPLCDSDLQVILNVIAELAPGWTAELTLEMAEDASIVLMPEDANDAIAPTLILYQNGIVYSVDQLHWDQYSTCGQYRSLPDAVFAVKALLIDFAANAPTSKMRH